MAESKPKENIDEILAESENIEVEKPEIEELPLDDFTLEKLIVEGKAARIERRIKYFDVEKDEIREMGVILGPITSIVWNKSAKTSANPKNDYSFEELICAKGCKEKDGTLVNLTDIRGMGAGSVESIFVEIKKISGFIEDRERQQLMETIFQ